MNFLKLEYDRVKLTFGATERKLRIQVISSTPALQVQF